MKKIITLFFALMAAYTLLAAHETKLVPMS